MTTNDFPSGTLGWVAIAIGGVTLIGLVSLILYFTFGSFFGTFSDVCIASEAILSALLAWMFYPAHRACCPRPCYPGQQTRHGRDPDAEVLGLGVP